MKNPKGDTVDFHRSLGSIMTPPTIINITRLTVVTIVVSLLFLLWSTPANSFSPNLLPRSHFITATLPPKAIATISSQITCTATTSIHSFSYYNRNPFSWSPTSLSRCRSRIKAHTLLHAKDNKKEEDEEKEEETKSKFRLNFWSKDDNEEEEDPPPPEPDKGEGLFRFLSSIKSEKEQKKKEKQKDDDNENDDGGFVKSITKRFSGNKDKKDDESDETPSPAPVEIDMRPTFVTFQRSAPEKTQIPNLGSRAMPADINKKSSPIAKRPTSNVPLSSKQSQTQSQPQPKQQQQSPPFQEPKRSKTLRLLQKVTRKSSDDKDKDKKEKDNDDDDSTSLMGRVQRMFATNSTSEDDNDTDSKDKDKKRKTTNISSVAQKFLSNVLDGSDKEEWVAVCPKTRLSPGEIVPVEVAGLDLIVVASKDAQNIYCMVNSCPHLGTPLETGFLERRPIETANSGSDSLSTPPDQLQESDIAALLANDGCEDCIVCPLHKTAFALKSGQVRGEWCPYPPVLGKALATVKNANSAAVFDVRTRGKNIEVRLNTPLSAMESASTNDKRKKKKSDPKDKKDTSDDKKDTR